MPPRHQTSFQIAVIGSGPAGLATAGQAADRGLSCVVLERADHLADTIHCYQKRKLVMAEPSLVPQRGDLPFDVGPRESVLDGWERYVAERGLDVRFGHEVTELAPARGHSGSSGYRLATPGGTFDAEKVVIAIGTQGNPRQLGVPGEDAPHVHDRLVDPDAHRDEEIVVVGAGDSALEVALALCERNRVHLIVRSAEIVRAKEALERDALTRASNDEMRIHYSSTVRAIGDGWVELQGPEGVVRVPAGRLIKKIGADPPRRLLEGWGVEFDGPGRDARPKLRVGYESASLPGVHLIGAVTGRDLIRLGINQGWEVVEHISGNPVEPADEDLLKERLPFWRGTVRERIEEIREALPVFAGASVDQLRETFLLVEPRELADGEVLIRQNDYTDDFLAIVDGKLRVTRREEGRDAGSERLVAEVGGGSFLGEMGLISGRRRNASATSLGTSRLLEVPRKAMLKLLRLAPAVKEAVDRVFLVRALGNVLGTAVQSELWRLAGRARLVELKKDEAVFQEGDESDALYLIRQGMVKLTRSSGDREVVLTYLVAGNYFGESALFGDRPRTATVSAIFPTELVALERDDFLEFLAGRPEDVRRRLVEGLEERQLASLRSESVPGVGEVLSQLIESEAVIGTDVLLIDNHKCVRCGNCLDACEAVHADGQARLTLHGDHVANLLLPNSCMQCENPLCMLDCPPDAIFRRPGGEIFIRDSCIGCGNCATNCPYDNIFMVQPKEQSSVIDWVKGLFSFSGGGGGDGNGDERGEKVTTPPTEGGELGVKQELAVKCDLCRDLRGGPACVRSCPTGAAIRLEPETPDDLRRDVEEMVDPGALL